MTYYEKLCWKNNITQLWSNFKEKFQKRFHLPFSIFVLAAILHCRPWLLDTILKKGNNTGLFQQSLMSLGWAFSGEKFFVIGNRQGKTDRQRIKGGLEVINVLHSTTTALSQTKRYKMMTEAYMANRKWHLHKSFLYAVCVCTFFVCRDLYVYRTKFNHGGHHA